VRILNVFSVNLFLTRTEKVSFLNNEPNFSCLLSRKSAHAVANSGAWS